MATLLRRRRLILPTFSAAQSFSPYDTSKYPQPLEAVWAGDPLQSATDGATFNSWRNGGSRGSGDPTIVAGLAAPTYRRVGIGLRPAFEMLVGRGLFLNIADIPQPYKLVAVAYQNDVGTGRRILGTGAADTARAIGTTSGSQWFTSAGTNLLGGTPASVVPAVVRSTLNGGSSQLWINGVSVASGSANTGAAEVFCLGAGHNAGAFAASWNGRIAYAAIYDGSVSDAALALLEADLIAHYAFNPLTQVSGLLHGVWASDPAWSHPADGAAVASWRNASGGGDPAQATGSAQPLWRLAGMNNQPSVQFDGTDDILDVDITDINAPYKVLVAIKSGSTASSAFLGSGANNGRYFGQAGPTQWTTFFGFTLSGGVLDTNAHVLRFVQGTSGLIYQDGAVVASGTTGAGTHNRFTIGGASDGVTPLRFWNGHVGYVGIFSPATPDADLVALQDNLRTFYSTA